MVLADGTVIPSHQGCVDTVRLGPLTEQFENWGLRLGLVRELILPTDDRSVSKKFTEYRVEVQYRNLLGGTNTRIYPNCYLASIFGGRGDKVKFTHRFAAKTTDAGLGEGSRVIIGHLSGDQHQAVILAGIRDQEDDPDEDRGHHLEWHFNGVGADVNDDGEFRLAFRGATNYDGTLRDGVDANATGTFLRMTKDGNFLVQHNDQKLELQHGEQAWLMEAQKNITQKVNDGDYLLDVTGIAEFFADREVTVGTRGHINLVSTKGVHIGADNAQEALILGDTYRLAQRQMNMQVLTQLGVATGLLTTAAASLLVPIAGPIAASPQLVLVAQALAQVVAAISQFESQAFGFLSKKNTTD